MKRLPVIRHIRYGVKLWRFNRWWRLYGHLFGFPNPDDIEYLEGVWSGKH